MNFNAGKIHLVSFDWSNNTGAIDVKKNNRKTIKKYINNNNKCT